MTTIAEVKRWMRPILAEHPDLVLDGRNLYLRPMMHIYRNIQFLGSSDRTFPKPTASCGILFAPTSSTMGTGLGRQLRVMYSTDPNFSEELAREIGEALQSLRRTHSIESLYQVTLEGGSIWDIPGELSRWPLWYAPVMLALGRLDEGCLSLEHYIDEQDEQRHLSNLADGRELQARRPRSIDASFRIDMATRFLARLNDMRQLHSLARANDRAGIGAILRDWEHARVAKLGLEDLWEPTPFPLERGL